MTTYREKTKEVEAQLFDGDTTSMMAVATWIQSQGYVLYDPFTPAPARGVTIDPSTGFLGIVGVDGVVRFAAKGDYIVKNISGEILPMKPDVFSATFEAIQDETPPEEGEPDTPPSE